MHYQQWVKQEILLLLLKFQFFWVRFCRIAVELKKLERYREALIISEANDLRMQIGELLARLGGVAPDRQRRMEYLQRALSVFRELGAQTRMREVQMMVHTAVMGR